MPRTCVLSTKYLVLFLYIATKWLSIIFFFKFFILYLIANFNIFFIGWIIQVLETWCPCSSCRNFKNIPFTPRYIWRWYVYPLIKGIIKNLYFLIAFEDMSYSYFPSTSLPESIIKYRAAIFKLSIQSQSWF